MTMVMLSNVESLVSRRADAQVVVASEPFFEQIDVGSRGLRIILAC